MDAARSGYWRALISLRKLLARLPVQRVATLLPGVSPLQYQKTLRLQEARRLMLTTMMDAGSAGRRVGYGSPSQFSREYGRFFGSAPTKDINRLREEGLASRDGA